MSKLLIEYRWLVVYRDEKMLDLRGIRRGIEVFVEDPANPEEPPKKARVIRTYPHPSRWLVVKFESGDVEQVEESYVTTMYEWSQRHFLG